MTKDMDLPSHRSDSLRQTGAGAHLLDHGGLALRRRFPPGTAAGIFFSNDLCESIHITLVYITQLSIDGAGD
jgi:hypothetical protein